MRGAYMPETQDKIDCNIRYIESIASAMACQQQIDTYDVPSVFETIAILAKEVEIAIENDELIQGRSDIKLVAVHRVFDSEKLIIEFRRGDDSEIKRVETSTRYSEKIPSKAIIESLIDEQL